MTEKRRRAPGMSPEERRAMIVAAALPLVAEYGTAVTTSQIARAAGIGEATIFRVFADKEEVLDACMHEAMRPDNAVKQIASISLDQPLPDRLSEAADALSAHLTRMGTIAGALYGSGHRRPAREATVQNEQEMERGRIASIEVIKDAVAELFEPDQDRLRLPAGQIAGVFLALTFTRGRVNGLAEGADLIEIFLYGALKAEEQA
ncbi:TetR/AcrR family transcriptional regulator [Nonomuraea sp. NPDC050536]|uniref:TetR/AcrR family transcriptional regulator n=1 Tax=Nonomuraea sp. NPDC050536 TaxID=3364366 RepID=UPI0037C611B6